MTTEASHTLSVRARGPFACFTRPEMKVERVSYPVMTPSAARGLLEAILWKPAIAWRVERIRVLRDIRFIPLRRNEVNRKAVAPPMATVVGGGGAPAYFADEDRTQRNTLALRDVDYVIDAHFEMTDRAGSGDNLNKFVDMFRRRIDKGQHFHQPYLGCREFVADIVGAEGAPDPIGEDRDLGLVLWDIEYGPKRNTPLFFHAELQGGVIEVPADPASTLMAGAAAS